MIRDCPTRGDRHFDRKVVRGGAGIPRDQIRLVDEADAPNVAGLVRLSDGALGVPMSQPSVLNALQAYATQTRQRQSLVPPQLTCRLCKGLARDAMRIKNCCASAFCLRCIAPDLLDDTCESTLYCPLCKRAHPLSALIVDDEARREVALLTQ